MPELGYWSIRGLAQPIRLLLNYVGEDFEDTHFKVGPAPDFDRSCWLSVKFTKGLGFPNLPYYIDGDIKLTQSNAILRYIARKHNLLGNTDEERVRVDVMLEQTMDLRNGFIQLCYNPKHDSLKPAYMEALPPKIKAFETFLADGPWFAGQNVTVADFHIYEMLDQHLFLDDKLLNDCPNLKAFLTKFEALPAMKKYMASEKCMRRPLNNPGALLDH